MVTIRDMVMVMDIQAMTRTMDMVMVVTTDMVVAMDMAAGIMEDMIRTMVMDMVVSSDWFLQSVFFSKFVMNIYTMYSLI